MIHLDLTDQEQLVLHEIVEDTLADLKAEIGRTDNFDYRARLKDRESVLNKILAQLETAPTDRMTSST